MQPSLKISYKHILMLVYSGLIVMLGLAIPFLPFKLQMILILAIPAMLMMLLIIKNPYVGIIVYFLFEYLRPYDMIPALAKLRIPMLTVLLTFVSFIFLNFRSSNYVKWGKFNWIFLMFLGSVGIMVPFALNNRFAYDTFQGLAINFVILFLTMNIVNSVKRLKSLIWLLLAIHLFLALKGIANYYSGSFSYGGMNTSGAVGSSFLGDENDFALALNVFIPFAFFMISVLDSKFLKFIGAGMLTVMVFGVISSVSRGGWVGLVAALLFSIFRSKQKMAGVIIMIVLCVLVFALAPAKYWNEIESISDTKESTAEARIQYWTAAVKMFRDHPVFGVGAGNGGVWMPDYVQMERDPNTQWGRTFHGTLPQIIAELGGVGLGLYLIMTFLALKYARKARNSIIPGSPDSDFLIFISNSIMGGIVAFYITAAFLSAAYYPQLWTLFTLSSILYFNSDTLIQNQVKA